MISKRVLLSLSLALASVPALAVTSWDLAGDYATATNPNGAWSYGEVADLTLAFTPLAWNAPTDSYGVGAVGNAFVYKNTGAFDYGINMGQVSLESDWQNAAVQWTAPAAGSYSFSIIVGGSTTSGPGGYGNNFATHGGVVANGVSQTEDSFVSAAGSNIKTWTFTTALAAGATVQTFVLNPNFANGGNTQVQMSVTAVPEPASVAMLGLGLGAVLLAAKRRRRDD